MLTFVDVTRLAVRRPQPPPTPTPPEFRLAYVPVLVRRPRSPRRRSSLVVESSHAEMVRAVLRRVKVGQGQQEECAGRGGADRNSRQDQRPAEVRSQVTTRGHANVERLSLCNVKLKVLPFV